MSSALDAEIKRQTGFSRKSIPVRQFYIILLHLINVPSCNCSRFTFYAPTHYNVSCERACDGGIGYSVRVNKIIGASRDWSWIRCLFDEMKNQLHAVSRTYQGRQKQHSVKKVRSPLSAEFCRHCVLSGRAQRRA